MINIINIIIILVCQKLASIGSVQQIIKLPLPYSVSTIPIDQ